MSQSEHEPLSSNLQSGANSGKGRRQRKQQKKKAVAADSNDEQVSSYHATLNRELRKTRFCMYHLQGACRYGSQCTFAHTVAEMHQPPDLSRTHLCEAFAKGQCNDSNCTFAHGEEELRSSEMFYKTSLCVWNEKGKCRNGSDCHFAHGFAELRVRSSEERSDEERSALSSSSPSFIPRFGQDWEQDWSAAYGFSGLYGVTPPMYAGYHQPQFNGGVMYTGTSSEDELQSQLAQLRESLNVMAEQCSDIQRRVEVDTALIRERPLHASLSKQTASEGSSLHGDDCQ